MALISNRPYNLERFLNSANKLGGLRSHIKIIAVLQGDGFESHIISGLDDYMFMPEYAPPIPFARLRRASIEMCSDCDVIWIVDDDMVFRDSGGSKFTKRCEDYYSEVLEFMRVNTMVGVISTRGYVGGSAWGYDVSIMPHNGLVSTDRGLFLRNIGVDRIISCAESRYVGALEESMAAYNIMSHGYTLAKRYNSPIQIDAPGASKYIGGSQNESYSDDVVDRNIQGYIRSKFNDANWTHSSKKYPRGLMELLSPVRMNHIVKCEDKLHG